MSVGRLNDRGDSGAAFRTTNVPSFQILGVRVHVVEMADTMKHLRAWIEDRQSSARFVAVTAMHGVAAAR